MLNGITAFEIKVTRLEGKHKLSQNKTRAAQTRAANALAAHDDPTPMQLGG